MSTPGSALPLLLRTAAPTGYNIERSLRFNSSDSAYCERNFTSAGNRKTWTFSCWAKIGAPGTVRQLFTCWISGSAYALFYIFSDDKISFDGGPQLNLHTTAAVYRDPGAWYHIQLTVDTTDATAANRVRLWINGTLQTWATTTAPTQNNDGTINTANAHRIGSLSVNSEFFNGYLADIHFIDGSALTPSDFAEINATTGQWVPKAFSGTYGTNGFWLKFSDNSNNTATTLGKDSSPNGNNFTPTNFSVTAGAGNDSLVDTPTSFGTDDGLGGSVRGNYATLNPLDQQITSVGTLSNGNLDYTQTSATAARAGRATIGVSTGKWYWECTHLGGNASIGIANNLASMGTYVGGDANGWSYFVNGTKYTNNSSTAYGASYTTNDIIGVALDMDAGTLVFYKNGVSQGTAYSSLSGTMFPAISTSGVSSVSCVLNFGQRPFAYTAPSGFKALVDASLPAPTVVKPSTVMDVKLYTGNGSTQTISGLGFSPDLVWIKNRANGVADSWHSLTDTVRGTNSRLFSNSTSAESTSADITAFNSDGFSLSNGTYVNYSSPATYVAWCWDAGSSNSTNTSGTITSTVRVNASSGFSVVTYTGNGTSGATIGHGLGVAPAFFIVKRRDTTGNWNCYHTSLGNTQGIYLDLTNAAGASSALWNNTSPTSTVISLGNGAGVNTNSSTYVCYAFAPVAGFSAFGSYTGNGSSDGSFVFTGMRPRWILIKRTDAIRKWLIFDTARDGYNPDNDHLVPDQSNAEDSTDMIDILSNGFKLRIADADVNASGGTYIFAAFAESPFQFSRAR